MEAVRHFGKYLFCHFHVFFGRLERSVIQYDVSGLSETFPDMRIVVKDTDADAEGESVILHTGKDVSHPVEALFVRDDGVDS